MSAILKPRSVLVVCTANRCRSPMAAALLAKIAADRDSAANWQITSAGTWAEPDLPATTLAQSTMASRGLDVSQHRARMVTGEMLSAASVILVMTKNHLEALRAEFPEGSARLFLLSQLVGQRYDIEDPFGGTREDYEACASELERLLNIGFTRLVEWADRAAANL